MCTWIRRLAGSGRVTTSSTTATAWCRRFSRHGENWPRWWMKRSGIHAVDTWRATVGGGQLEVTGCPWRRARNRPEEEKLPGAATPATKLVDRAAEHPKEFRHALALVQDDLPCSISRVCASWMSPSALTSAFPFFGFLNGNKSASCVVSGNPQRSTPLLPMNRRICAPSVRPARQRVDGNTDYPSQTKIERCNAAGYKRAVGLLRDLQMLAEEDGATVAPPVGRSLIRALSTRSAMPETAPSAANTRHWRRVVDAVHRVHHGADSSRFRSPIPLHSEG